MKKVFGAGLLLARRLKGGADGGRRTRRVVSRRFLNAWSVGCSAPAEETFAP